MTAEQQKVWETSPMQKNIWEIPASETTITPIHVVNKIDSEQELKEMTSNHLPAAAIVNRAGEVTILFSKGSAHWIVERALREQRIISDTDRFLDIQIWLGKKTGKIHGIKFNNLRMDRQDIHEQLFVHRELEPFDPNTLGSATELLPKVIEKTIQGLPQEASSGSKGSITLTWLPMDNPLSKDPINTGSYNFSDQTFRVNSTRRQT